MLRENENFTQIPKQIQALRAKITELNNNETVQSIAQYIADIEQSLSHQQSPEMQDLSRIEQELSGIDTKIADERNIQFELFKTTLLDVYLKITSLDRNEIVKNIERDYWVIYNRDNNQPDISMPEITRNVEQLRARIAKEYAAQLPLRQALVTKLNANIRSLNDKIMLLAPNTNTIIQQVDKEINAIADELKSKVKNQGVPTTKNLHQCERNLMLLDNRINDEIARQQHITALLTQLPNLDRAQNLAENQIRTNILAKIQTLKTRLAPDNVLTEQELTTIGDVIGSIDRDITQERTRQARAAILSAQLPGLENRAQGLAPNQARTDILMKIQLVRTSLAPDNVLTKQELTPINGNIVSINNAIAQEQKIQDQKKNQSKHFWVCCLLSLTGIGAISWFWYDKRYREYNEPLSASIEFIAKAVPAALVKRDMAAADYDYPANAEHRSDPNQHP